MRIKFSPCLVAALLLSHGLHAQTATETQVTATEIIDPEYDKSGARLTYTDRDGNLWLADIDKNTGAFLPSDGRGKLLDIDAAFTTDFGNGSEWVFSSAGAKIVYTKYLHGQPHSAATAGSAIAIEGKDGTWTAGFINNAGKTRSPIGSSNLQESAVYINYQGTGKEFYWRTLNGPDSTAKLVPQSDQSEGSRRWVDNTHSIIFTAGAKMSDGSMVQQVFLYNTDNNSLKQLTTDYAPKLGGFMWDDPELKERVFFTMVDRKTLNVYRKNSNGSWYVWKIISMPPKMPYVWSPEPFVFNGRSYIFMQVSSSTNANDMSVPTQLAITGINPNRVDFRMLTNDTNTKRVRMDPEYFFLNSGPVIYYNRYKLSTSTTKSQSEGIWKVDTGLGPAK